MGKIIVRKELQAIQQLCAIVDKQRWSAIIPAAGTGSRLGYEKPKLLFPILGKPIVDWLCDILIDICGELIFVLSPQGEKPVREYLANRPVNYKIALQHSPNGMAKAIRAGIDKASNENIVVLWGDQVTASQETIRICQALHQQVAGRTLTLPTIIKEQPYIHLQRDADNRIVNVLERRETTQLPTQGENDCGIFLFNRTFLRTVLENAFENNEGKGATTHEFNLLPLLPKFEVASDSVVTLQIDDLMQTLGVNTREDAERAAGYLAKQ